MKGNSFLFNSNLEQEFIIPSNLGEDLRKVYSSCFDLFLNFLMSDLFKIGSRLAFLLLDLAKLIPNIFKFSKIYPANPNCK